MGNRFFRAFIILLSSCIYFGCTPKDNYLHKVQRQAGICLSFDDRSIQEWYDLRHLLKRYHANVTFFVTQWDSLTQDEIAKLRELQLDGHEIGFHGALHVVSEYYIKDHSIDKYLNDEIAAGIRSMRESQFYPTSFAYPYSAKYWGTDSELLKYFYVIRSEKPLKEGGKPDELDEVYYDFKGQRLVYALSLEGRLTTDQLSAALSRAKDKNEVLILYGHVPGKTVSLKLLEEVLLIANRKGLKFFRTSELVGRDF